MITSKSDALNSVKYVQDVLNNFKVIGVDVCMNVVNAYVKLNEIGTYIQSVIPDNEAVKSEEKGEKV